MLPEFLIIGAQKAGTTWLLHMLRQHPGIFMPPSEIHFFNKAEHYERGFDWYARHFVGCAEHQLRGEKTPNYLWVNVPEEGSDVPGSHWRIARALPRVKLIAVLRDPVERAISAYNHHLRKGRFPPHASVEEVLFGRHAHLARRHGVLSMGCYHTQLTAYLEVFGRDRILVFEFQGDVVDRPHETLARVCEFLDVQSASRVGFEDVSRPQNVMRASVLSPWANYWLPPSLSRKLAPVNRFLPRMTKRMGSRRARERLVELYHDEVTALRELLDRPFSAWQV